MTPGSLSFEGFQLWANVELRRYERARADLEQHGLIRRDGIEEIN